LPRGLRLKRNRKKGKSTAARGREGEASAAAYLLRVGYIILEKNFRRRTGEVDIVCERSGTLVFVEVKRWPRAFRSELNIALSGQRLERLRRTAELFLQERPKYRDHRIRFDLLFVATGGGEIEHIPGAL
jgi:putative endonuclease